MTVRPNDRRYLDLVSGFNRRWQAAPDSVRLAGSTKHVVRAVQEAVSAGKRLSIRSGGHSYGDFTYHKDVDIIVDLSMMNSISYDPHRRAFAIESGAQLGQVYERLFRGWGVTLPGGVCPSVGIGGHATGGGHGLLSRQYGYVCDLIEAVEIVVVDRHRRARTVIASRQDSGDLHDLWWACSGGGGGNFGVITKFWFRSRDACGHRPELQLPRPPREVLISTVFATWDQLDQAAFTRLVRNQCQWYMENSEPGSPGEALCGLMFLQHVSSGGIGLLTQVDAAAPNAEKLLEEYLGAVTANTGLTGPFPFRRLPWLASTVTLDTSNPTVETNATLRAAVKHAFMRQAFTEDQCAAMYRQLTRRDYANASPGSALIQLGAMAGGRMNAPAPTDTALCQRSSAYVALFEDFWLEAAEDDKHLGWLRELYGQVFASTGGYPVPGDRYQGCNINAPDLDILSPALNASGVPWHAFYFGENYPRLQRTKARWDPSDVFRHSLSVKAA
ncbi:FAD-dependent oxidoreductase [Streptomyces sp. NBRC 110611]|uniref:FAD-dependent oxidoreductase n=1 Tax=Streptomyces sp. NBRC 110611 TaxID=1621259 RepID=UPI00082CFC8E|nr:FAD-binding protein [Streptomyces sp. NBRC 110611]